MFRLLSLLRKLSSLSSEKKITINSLKYPERHENTPCNAEVTTSCLLYQNTFMAIPALSDWWKPEASNLIKFLLMLPLAKRPQQFLHCSNSLSSSLSKDLGQEREKGEEQWQRQSFPWMIWEHVSIVSLKTSSLSLAQGEKSQGANQLERSSAEKQLRIPGQHQAECEPATQTCSKEGQWHPGLHRKSISSRLKVLISAMFGW